MEVEAATQWFQLWFRELCSLRHHLDSARLAGDPARISDAVSRFVVHHESHYDARARHQDPLLTLSAPWDTPAERGVAHWLAGWRPTTLIHLIYTECGRSLEAQLPDLLAGRLTRIDGGLTPQQLQQIDALQRRTIAEEDELTGLMAGVQDGRVGVRGAPGAAPDVQALTLVVGRLLARADELRLRVMKRTVEILEPVLAAELLIAVADMELSIRRFGLQHGSGPGN